MKTQIRMRMVMAVLTLALLGGVEVRAATYWWDGPTAGWDAVANWSTVSSATTPDPAAVPGSADTVIFHIDGNNSAATNRLNAAQSVYGMVFRSTGLVTLNANQSGATARTLTLGSGGITLGSGGKAVVNGSSTVGTLTLPLGADQTWRNFNTDSAGTSHNFVFGGNAVDAASDVDLSGRALTIVGDAGLQLSHNSAHGRILATGGGSVALGANGVLRFNNRSTALNTDRLADAVGITSYGGKVHFYVATGTNANYSETVGTLTLSKGALNHVQDTQVAATYTSTFTYGGLSRPAGSLGTIAFNPAGLTSLGDATAYAQNKLVITGQADTGLIGGWATIGSISGFAAYDATRGVCLATAIAMVSGENSPTKVANSGNITADTTVGALIQNNTPKADLGTRKLTLAAGGLMWIKNNAINSIINGTLTAGAGGTSAPLFVWNVSGAVGGYSHIITAVIADNSAGTLDLVKSGPGMLTLGGANTYSGSTVVNEGTLQINKANSQSNFGTCDGTANITVADTSVFAPGVQLSSSVSSPALGTRYVVAISSPTVLIANNNIAADHNGALSAPAISGSIAASPTIEVLYGATLDVTYHRTATWTVGSGQTLKGNGTVVAKDPGGANRTIQMDGKVAPGSSAGTLTVTGNVVFANNSILEVEAKNALLGGDKWEAGYDRLTVAGTVDLGSNAKLDISLLSGESLAVGDRLFIIDNDGSDAVSGKFKTMGGMALNEGDSFTDGKSFKIYYAADLVSGALSGGNDVALEVIPPLVTLIGTVTNASENPGTNGVVTVSRGNATNGALTLYYTIGGTATPGAGAGGDFTNSPAADYVNKTGAVTIADGQTNATITIYPIDDTTYEVPETVILALTNNAAYTIASPSNATVDIASDDAAGGTAPTIYTNGVDAGNTIATNVNEDCGTVDLSGLGLYAVDPDGASWTWTNTTTPASGTVSVSGTGTNPVAWTPFTYTPNANFNGTNSFVVQVSDNEPLTDSITVTVVVAAVNDAPVKMTDPVLQSPGSAWLFSDVWTHTSGTWQDNADTNANYTDATFQGAKTFLYQWQWSNSATMGDINLATNAALTPNDFGGYVGTNLRVSVWCVDDRWPSGTSATSAPAYTGWQTVQGVPVLAPVITNAGPLETTIWEDAASTDLQALFSLLATNIAEAGTLTWGVAVAPTQGTANVSGGTTVSSAPSTFTYQPAANLNGGDSFVVCVSNGVGLLSSNITVNIDITVVNDPPTNTVAPDYTGTRLVGNLLTVTNGVWNDNVDTNASYTHAVFTNTAIFAYQWQRATNGSGDGLAAIANATNAAYTLTWEDKYKWVRAAVTCTDGGFPAPGASATANTSWQQENSTVPTLVTFTNLVGNGLWTVAGNWAPADVPTTNINAVIGDANVKSPVTATIGASDAAATKALTLGQNTGANGALTMTGGTLTGNGSLTLGNVASSTGTINQTGGTVANYTTPILGASGNGSWNMSGSATATNLSVSFYMGQNAGSVGKLLLQDSAVWSNGFASYLRVGSDQFGTSGGDGTVEVNGGTFWITKTGGGRALQLGGAGGIGRLVLTGGSATVGSLGLSLGYSATGTGVLSVAGGTYNGEIAIGAAGQGYVYATNNGTLSAAAVTMGFGAGSNAYMLVDGNATVTANKLTLGNAAGNVSTLDLNSGTTTVSAAGANTLSVGFAAGSTGLVTVAGGSHTWSSDSVRPIGDGAGTFGRVRITGGSLSASGGTSVGNQGSGELLIEGGAFTNSSTLDLGYASGGFGRVQVTGGQWVQTGALRVGAFVVGGTGIVTVANCVSTNITGAMTVGGGTTGGDRYGSVTISNATFGGGTAVSVLTNGFVELTGIGSKLPCNTFTCRGGAVTNYLKGMAGGVDVTNSLGTALVITNGGKMHLVFEVRPGRAGDFWGLRWAGNGHAAKLAAMTNANALVWDGAAATGVLIYTNATHTMVGYFAQDSGTTFRFR